MRATAGTTRHWVPALATECRLTTANARDRGNDTFGETDMPDFLIYEQDGPLVTLTMNQPETRNPLTGNTAIPEFLAAIDRIHDDRGVRCVILTANGPSFSAGGDIRE